MRPSIANLPLRVSATTFSFSIVLVFFVVMFLVIVFKSLVLEMFFVCKRGITEYREDSKETYLEVLYPFNNFS